MVHSALCQEKEALCCHKIGVYACENDYIAVRVKIVGFEYRVADAFCVANYAYIIQPLYGIFPGLQHHHDGYY